MGSAPALRFGTDGVRGHAFEDLTPAAVASLGRAAARVLGPGRRFLLARDTRESGPALEAALAAGLGAEGCEVESEGVLPTPGLAFLSQSRALPAAMVSASHNPFHDNGIKFFGPGGRKLPDALEAEIEAVLAGLGVADAPATTPLPTSRESCEEYLAHLVGAVEGRTFDGFHVVVDCANGAATRTAPEVLGRLGAKVSLLACEPDGRNINDQCGSTHPGGLQQAVVEAGADAGLAFDGDADRVIAVDERGQLVDGDHILAIAALDLRRRGRLTHDTVVATVMANLGFRRAMEAEGIHVVETTVGDRYVLEAMDAGGYALGGEQSGHVIFADLATTGDGVLTGLMLLDAVTRSGRSLSSLASVVTKFPQVLENVRVGNRAGLDAAGAFWAEVDREAAELDGSGRVLVRPSGTEPLVRIMVEAPTEAEAAGAAHRLAEVLLTALGNPRA